MKYCTRCGRQILDDAVICPNCGCEQETQRQRSNETNGMAIAGFVCSFFFPLLGLIFGGIGLKKANETGQGKGLSVAAIIISLVCLVPGLLILKAIFLALLSL